MSSTSNSGPVLADLAEVGDRQEEVERLARKLQYEAEEKATARRRKANGPDAESPPEKPSRSSGRSNVTAVALEFLSLHSWPVNRCEPSAIGACYTTLAVALAVSGP